MVSLRDELKRPFEARTVLFFVMVLGLALRLPGLGRDVWYDETWSVFNARGTDVAMSMIPNGPELTSHLFARDGGWRGLLQAVSHSENIPPFYFLLLRIWIKIFGESNLILRLFSVILGLATILVVFFLGRKVFDERVGLAGAGMLAILPLHIQFSQEIRAYALATLLVALASWAFWSAYQTIGQREEKWYWILYTGLATAGLYTHYFTAGALVAHGVFAVIELRSLPAVLMKRLIYVGAVIALLLTPWFLSPYFKNELQILNLLPGTYKPTFWASETLKRIPALMCYFFAGFLPDVRFKSVFGLILFSLYGMSVLGLRFRRERKTTSMLFASLLLLMPILFLISLAAILDRGGLLANPKFVLSASTGLCLLLGAAIISSHQRTMSSLIAITAVALSLHFMVKWHHLNRTSPPAWWSYVNVSPAVAKVNQKAKPDELILFEEGDLLPIWNVYQKAPLPQLLMSKKGFWIHSPMDFDSRWHEVQRKYVGIYLVRRVTKPTSETLERLEMCYQQTSNEQVGGLEIRHYIKSR